MLIPFFYLDIFSTLITDIFQYTSQLRNISFEKKSKYDIIITIE